MKPTALKPSRLTAASALTAAFAAIALTACEPNDSAETTAGYAPLPRIEVAAAPHALAP
jgi:hypothetical protein